MMTMPHAIGHMDSKKKGCQDHEKKALVPVSSTDLKALEQILDVFEEWNDTWPGNSQK